MDNEEKQQPLANLPTNTHLHTTSTAEGDNEKTMHPKENGFLQPAQLNQSQPYVSPSDGIMSPCTKKLSDIKGKRFKKAGKPQTLFAKTIQKKSLDNANANAKDDSSAAPEEDGGSKEE